MRKRWRSVAAKRVETQLHLNHLRRETRTALELAVFALGPRDLVDRLAAPFPRQGTCRSHRHQEVKEQHAALTRRIAGHFNYFGVNGNLPALRHVARACEIAWHKWLNRKSQRARLNWPRFESLLRDYPLPKAQVRVQLWQPAS